jgi:hypothetical protein
MECDVQSFTISPRKRCGGRVMAGGVAYARNKEMLMPMI